MKETMKLYNMFDNPDQKPNPTGTEYDPVREWQIDDKGNRQLIVTGQTNRWAKIQEYAEETKLANIIVKATVDPSVLNERNGIYEDFTKFPKDLAEMQNIIIKVKNEFAGLPKEIREKFGNNPETYVAMYGSKEFADIMGLTQEETKALEPGTIEPQKGEVTNEPEQ